MPDDGTLNSDEPWGEAHEYAMICYDYAERLELDARGHLEKAAESEQKAVELVPEDKPRTRAILQRSAVSLWLRAAKPKRAIALARKYLEGDMLPGFRGEMEAMIASEEARLHDGEGRPTHESGP